MNPLHGLSTYLIDLERRLRLLAVSKGAALSGVSALLVTIAAVFVANQFGFSNASVFLGRVTIFLTIAAALSIGLIVPLLRLNRSRAARQVETRYPEFGQRLVTFIDRERTNAADPFLPLLAEDALSVASRTDAQGLAPRNRLVGFASAALLALLVLIWLGVSGPGYLGFGTSLLWAGVSNPQRKPFYDIEVEPGNKLVRRRSDARIVAKLHGFDSVSANVFARYASSTKWEQAPMQPLPGHSGFEFLFVGLPENVQYYVASAGIQSQTFRIGVVDLPGVKKLRVTYHFPPMYGLKDQVEDPGGDLRALEGTVAELEIETDRPLTTGSLVLDDSRTIPLTLNLAGKLTARVPIQKDGMYHVAAADSGEMVRLTEDYFIEARKDSPPYVTVVRPVRDLRASPIEEVTIAVSGRDDFGLQNLDLHYSVNGAPEKTVNLLTSRGAKNADGSTTLALEDFKLQPGDLVSFYASARDARTTSRTNIAFIEARPFLYEYTQAQSGGSGGSGQQDDEISKRQKEVISATWNQIKDTAGSKTDAAENAKYLSDVQAKLREQAKSLAQRMKAREIAESNPAFKAFVDDMEKAAEQMSPAADQLRTSKWNAALVPEQKSLQYLLRAEAIFRQIQVSFGKSNGGGGGGGASRDLEGLLNLELDTGKNQYETGQESAAEQRQRQIDEALKKLEDLARRQQQLAAQQPNPQQTYQQRWQQEMLRREAEQLRRELEQLTRNSTSQDQNGSQSSQEAQQQSQNGDPSAQQNSSQSNGQKSGQRQSGSQARSSGAAMGGQASALREALDRLENAARDMSSSTSARAHSPSSAESQADARRAAERLQEAHDLVSNLRQNQTGAEMGGLAGKAQKLTAQQADFGNRLRKNFANGASSERSEAQNRALSEQMAQEKEAMIGDLKRLEHEMQQAARDLAQTQPDAASKLRDGIGFMQQEELQTRMQWTVDILHKGLGSYAVMREAPVTQSLRDLSERLSQAQNAMKRGTTAMAGQQDLQKALEESARFRRQMEQQLGGKPGEGSRTGQQAGQRQQGQGRQASGSQPGDSRQAAAGQEPGSSGQPGQTGQGRQPGTTPSGRTEPGAQPSNSEFGIAQSGGPGGPHNGYAGEGGWDAMNMGNWQPPDPATVQRSYESAINELNRLQQMVSSDPETAKDLQALLRETQRLDPRRFPGNPQLLAQLEQHIMAEVEQAELILRRKLEAGQGIQVRSTTPQSIPPGYRDAIADYFRRLSQPR